MPASWCPHCQDITIVEYSELNVLGYLVISITCTNCHKEISKRWVNLYD